MTPDAGTTWSGVAWRNGRGGRERRPRTSSSLRAVVAAAAAHRPRPARRLRALPVRPQARRRVAEKPPPPWRRRGTGGGFSRSGPRHRFLGLQGGAPLARRQSAEQRVELASRRGASKQIPALRGAHTQRRGVGAQLTTLSQVAETEVAFLRSVLALRAGPPPHSGGLTHTHIEASDSVVAYSIVRCRAIDSGVCSRLARPTVGPGRPTVGEVCPLERGGEARHCIVGCMLGSDA